MLTFWFVNKHVKEMYEFEWHFQLKELLKNKWLTVFEKFLRAYFGDVIIIANVLHALIKSI